MSSEIDLFSLSSTYVVLEANGDATPIAVSDRFFENLERKFGATEYASVVCTWAARNMAYCQSPYTNFNVIYYSR
jgi:hypothetical protein